MPKALALFSGGLDSLLAVRLVMDQGIEVIAIQFITPFFNYTKKGVEAEAEAEFLVNHGFSCRFIDITDEYVKMVRNPKYGYGKNFNPCIDCKIFMMSRAKELMTELGADFIISGEVLGQRPMSQRRDALRIVERDSGLDYYLLRPLCAKHMKPTFPEENGMIDREKLGDLSGRSRRRQMDMAEAYDITEYQTPAGGCLLADPTLSKRIARFLKDNETVTATDLMLLSTGRHFSMPGGMLYLGRNIDDNKKLADLVRDTDVVLKTRAVSGPLGLYRGVADDESLTLAARLIARYSDARDLPEAQVAIKKGGAETVLTVVPLPEAETESYRAVY